MECPDCAFDNRADRRFCSECGAPLLRICPECDFRNEPNDKFCGGCGAKLSRETRVETTAVTEPNVELERAPAATATGPAGGERRYVTIMFADISGYTRMLERLDAEDLHDTVGRLLDRIDKAVEAHGGTVHRHVGDEVMALFGTPVAHGDDPLRAVLAAEESHQAIAALSRTHDQDLAIHIGIACGTVVIAGHSLDDGTMQGAVEVTGIAANLGSRLNQMAGSRETVISDEVHAALAGRFDCEPLGAVEIRGLEEPVKAWRVKAARRAEEAKTERAKFVGRHAEKAQFDGVLAACLEHGTGQAVLVRGEAGIGKSRLLREFEAAACAKGARCHRVLVLDFGTGTGEDAITAMVHALLALNLDSDREAREAAIGEALAKGWVTDDQRVFLNDYLRIPQDSETAAQFDAMDNAARKEGRSTLLTSLMIALSAESPLFLAVEDVHWAAPEIIDHIFRMADAARHCRALFAMTTRIDGDPIRRLWHRMGSYTPLMTIDLGPLRESEALALAASSVGVAEEFAKNCVARAEGNPLFLEQLVFGAQSELGREIPGTIQSVVMARVDRLEEEDRVALQAASAIGQRFALDALRAVLGDTAYDGEGLLEAFLVRREGEDFHFAHALIRDAVYGSLLNRTRRTFHGRLAEWYRERDPRLYAEHLGQANAPEAARAYLDAARIDAERHRYGTALGLVRKGLDLATEGADIVALHLLAGECHHNAGDMAEAAKAFDIAVECASDARDRVDALIGLAGVKRVIDDIDGAFADLARAEEDAEKEVGVEEMHPHRARIHFLRGNLLFPRGDLDGCLTQHKEGLRFARLSGRPDLEAASLGGLGDAEYVRGRMVSARNRLNECVALGEAHNLGRIVVANRAQAAHATLYAVSHNEAYDIARDAVRDAMRVGHSRAEINARGAIVKAAFGLACYEECLGEIDRLNTCVDRLGATRFRQISAVMAGSALTGLGRDAEARTSFEAGYEFVRETGIEFHGPSLLTALARIVPDKERQDALVEEALAVVRGGCVGHNQYRVYADCIDIAYRRGDKEMLSFYLDAAGSFPEGEEVAFSLYQAKRGRAFLAALDDPSSVEFRKLREETLAMGTACGFLHWNRPLESIEG